LGLGFSSAVLRFSLGVLGFSLALALKSWALTLWFRLWFFDSLALELQLCGLGHQLWGIRF